jgi:hypothetical protein
VQQIKTRMRAIATIIRTCKIVTSLVAKAIFDPPEGASWRTTVGAIAIVIVAQHIVALRITELVAQPR